MTLAIREFSHRISLVFMISLALALLLLGRAETYVIDQARQVVTDMAAPLLEMVSRPVAAARRLVERSDQYAYVFDENERLREENARLLAWKEAALKLEAKVARYEALLNVQVDPSISYVTGPAKVFEVDTRRDRMIGRKNVAAVFFEKLNQS